MACFVQPVSQEHIVQDSLGVAISCLLKHEALASKRPSIGFLSGT